MKSLDCEIDMVWLQKMAANETANIVTYLIGGKAKSNEMNPVTPAVLTQAVQTSDMQEDLFL